MVATMPKRSNTYGPYAEPRGDGRYRLSAAGSDFVTQYLDEHPNPIRVFSKARITSSLFSTATRCGLTPAEINSLCKQAIVEAALRFDPERGFKFNTYAVWWMRSIVGNEIDRIMRAVKRGVSVLGDEDILHSTPGDETKEETAGDHDWMRDRINEILARYTTPWRRQVYSMKYGLGEWSLNPLTIEEIAQEMHVSREKIRQVLNTVNTLIYHELALVRDIWDTKVLPNRQQVQQVQESALPDNGGTPPGE